MLLTTIAQNVVPRTGYVDRNIKCYFAVALYAMSYPARGTWIEIFCIVGDKEGLKVVPRTGYVDRNVLRLMCCPPQTSRTPHGVRG